MGSSLFWWGGVYYRHMGFENSSRPRVESKRAEAVARLQVLQREYVRLDEEIKQERHAAETAANGDPKLLRVIDDLEAPKVAELLEIQGEMLDLEERLENDPALAPEAQSEHIPAESQRVLGREEREQQAGQVWNDPLVTGGDPERRGNNNPTF